MSMDDTTPYVQQLTRREQIAAMAMAGLLANTDYTETSYEKIAKKSVGAADELLKALESRGPS